MEAKVAAGSASPTSEESEPDERKQRSSSSGEKKRYSYANKQEAKEAFRQLLEDRRVHPDDDWTKAMKKIINDERWTALKSVGEKRATFAEWADHKRKEEREALRMQRKKARDDFMQMLDDNRDRLSGRMSFRKATQLLSSEPRFTAVEHDGERAELYDDWAAVQEKRERQQAEERHKRHVAAFQQLLEERVDNDSLDYRDSMGSWRRVKDMLSKEHAFTELDREERMVIWDQFIRNVRRREDERKEREREQRKALEKQQRDDFRDMLRDRYRRGTLSLSTRWKEMETQFINEDNELYVALRKQTGPRVVEQIFEDIVDDLHSILKEDRRRVKTFLQDKEFHVVATGFEQFSGLVRSDERLSTIDEQNLRCIFDELVEREAKNEKEKERKRQKLLDKFKDLVKDFIHKQQKLAEEGAGSLDTTKEDSAFSLEALQFDKCVPFFQSHSSFDELQGTISTEEQQQVFRGVVDKQIHREERRKRRRSALSGDSEAVEQESLSSPNHKKRKSDQPAEESNDTNEGAKKEDGDASTENTGTQQKALAELELRRAQILAALGALGTQAAVSEPTASTPVVDNAQIDAAGVSPRGITHE